jgi:hypothetical protein
LLAFIRFDAAVLTGALGVVALLAEFDKASSAYGTLSCRNSVGILIGEALTLMHVSAALGDLDTCRDDALFATRHRYVHEAGDCQRFENPRRCGDFAFHGRNLTSRRVLHMLLRCVNQFLRKISQFAIFFNSVGFGHPEANALDFGT